MGGGYQQQHPMGPEGFAAPQPHALVTPLPKPKGKVGRPRNSVKLNIQ